jgi:ATP-dependent DNA helicase RecG
MNIRRDVKVIKPIKNFIKSGESESLEFKSSLADINEIVEDVSAFSNSKGGKILIGISNSGEVVGVEIGKDTIERLTNKIVNNTEPKVFPSIRVEKIEKKKIIVIEIQESKEKPVFAFGRAFKRVGKSTLRMSKDEIERLILEKKKVYWDSLICEEASLEDIDEEKVRWYLERREKMRKMPKQIDIKTLLINIGAAKETNGKVKPTNAGILFFGKNPQRFIPTRIIGVRFKGTELSRTTIDTIDCHGTLPEMIEQVEDFVRRNIRLFGFRTKYSFERIDKLEYPMEAIREAIINALIHRDYFELTDVQLFIFDDRIEIINPGPFPEGVSPEKPIHKPRNPILCQLMRDIGFIEKYGSGIYFMKNLCREWGIKEPEYEITETKTKVIFRSAGESILVSEIERVGIRMNLRQKRALEYALKEGFLTNKLYREINKVSDETARKELLELVEEGLLRMVGRGRGIKYLPKI